ncbi:MAG: leucine-rich repeat domain-containing protein [Ferruginibacter sp.]
MFSSYCNRFFFQTLTILNFTETFAAMMRMPLFLILLFIFGCKHKSKTATIPDRSNSIVIYDSGLSISNQDSLISKTSRNRDFLSRIADSSNSFCKINKDTQLFFINTGRYEGAYFLDIKIIKDTPLVTFKLFDHYSKYVYPIPKFTITVDKKTIIPGDYITAKIFYSSIGKLNDGHQFQYDTVAFSGKIRLKVRDNKFTAGDLMEEDFKNRFYTEASQRPDTIKKLFLYTSKWMSEIPKEIMRYTNLEELYLEGTDLSKADLSPLCNLSHLKHLALGDCNLSEIPPCFNSLKNLEELDVHLNHLRNIPDCIYELSNLKDLDIESNNISTLSPNIKRLRKLESLGLEKTNISRLPDEMVSLSRLREIYTNDTMEYIPRLLLRYLQNEYHIQK